MQRGLTVNLEKQFERANEEPVVNAHEQHEKIRNDHAKQQRLQILTVDEHGQEIIKISHLCFIACKSVFNLSMQQFDAAKSIIYRELDDLLPQRLQYVPQGINPRQWI